MYKRTEAYVKDFNIKTPQTPDGSEAHAIQYAIVNVMANHGNQIIAGVRQSGITLGTLMGMKYLQDIEEKKAIMVVRNRMLQNIIRRNAEEFINFHDHNIVVQEDVTLDELAEYDVVVIDSYIYLKDTSRYLILMDTPKPPKLVFSVSADNRATLRNIGNYGGRFNVLSLVPEDEKWGSIEEQLNRDPEELHRNFFNTWTCDEKNLGRKEKNRLGIREPGEGGIDGVK